MVPEKPAEENVADVSNVSMSRLYATGEIPETWYQSNMIAAHEQQGNKKYNQPKMTGIKVPGEQLKNFRNDF